VQAATFVISFVLLLSGCGVSNHYREIPMTDAERALTLNVQAKDSAVAEAARSDIVTGHPEWNDDIKLAIKRGEVLAGMTRLQVQSAWGWDIYCRQFAGGHIIDRQCRERWLYDRAPMLVMAYFVGDTFVTARAYDGAGTPVAIDSGTYGLRLPDTTAATSQRGDDRLLHLALRIDPVWDADFQKWSANQRRDAANR